jgi:peptide/nickel transport system permease protein
MWGVVTVIFFLFNILPGDPARMVMGQRSDSLSLAMARRDLGLDKSTGLQYLKYLNDLSPLSFHNTADASAFFYIDRQTYGSFIPIISFGNNASMVLKAPYLRRSFQSRELVWTIIRGSLMNTFVLALISIVLAGIVGILLGIISALYKDSWFDRSSLVMSAMGMSLPSFFAAIIIGWLFAFVLGKYTGLPLTGNLYAIDDFGEGIHLQLKNIILPAITVAIRPLAVFQQLTRSSVLDVLSQDYIRTARAKGLSTYRIISRHILRNALNPIVTAVSGWFASLMAGVVFVEYIYGWKGLGYLVVDALNNYDLPLLLGLLLVIAILFLIISILVDLIYAILDPRVRIS